MGVATHILKYNGINQRNTVGIHVCLYILSILKDNILVHVLIKNVMIKELETVTVDAVNASNMIEHFMWVFFNSRSI